MRHRVPFFVLVFIGWGLALAQSTPAASGQQPKANAGTAPPAQVEKPPAERVRTKLDGFDLAPKKEVLRENTQVAGGSRGFGTPTHLRLYAPHKARLYSLRPILAWEIHSPMQKVVFRLLTESDDVTYEATVTGSSLRYPANAPPLQPGKTYRWTIHPYTGLVGGPAEPVEIVLLTDNERQAISSQLQAPGADAATIFFDQRLWYDAVDACTQAIEKTPEVGRLYEQRGTIYYQIDATESLAERDFDKAEELAKRQR